MARSVLRARRALGPNNVSIAALAQEQENLDTAEALLDVASDRDPDLANAVALGRATTAWQARALGARLARRPYSSGSRPRLPSTAIRSLAQRFGVSPDVEAKRGILRLDRLPERPRTALTEFLDTFLALDSASRDLYNDLDYGEPHAAPPSGDAANEGARIRLAGSPRAVGEVLVAREALLEAAIVLHQAFGTDRVRASGEPAIQVPPVLAIDPDGADNTYKHDFMLVLDVGGNDTYLNNAGGNRWDVRSACYAPPAAPASALVDLSGDDRYVGRGSCGTNGGGYAGVGFLFDAGGNDRYRAAFGGVNGGGSLGGLGFLLDLSGNDRYSAGGGGANGGGGGALAGGAGALLDLSGNDTYSGGDQGSNGGGWFGAGFLFDGNGRDRYTAGSYGTNGAGLLGAGFLLDAGGDDRYSARVKATNGGGLDGSGFLLDAGGNDRYKAQHNWANGGSSAGAGMLIDVEGNDRYTAGDYGTNGGGADHNAQPGSGFLLDGAGDDVYKAGKHGVNGGEGGADVAGGQEVPGRGLLFDMSGRDIYVDRDGGSGTDCTVAPKGTFGAQIDAPRAAC